MEVDFPLGDVAFKKDEIYKLAIVNVPQVNNMDIKSNIVSKSSNLNDSLDIQVSKQQAEGTLNLLSEKEIYAHSFRTSSYTTFGEKMAAIPNGEGVLWQEHPHVCMVGSNIYDLTSTTEMFDVFENNSLQPDQNLVVVTPVYSQTVWYSQHVKPLIYGNTAILNNANELGLVPPANYDVARIYMAGNKAQLSKEIIESDTRLQLSQVGSINYRAPYYVDIDFMRIRKIIAGKVSAGENNAAYADFLSVNHIPDITNGDYEVKFSYRLPGKDIVTSAVNRVINLS